MNNTFLELNQAEQKCICFQRRTYSLKIYKLMPFRSINYINKKLVSFYSPRMCSLEKDLKSLQNWQTLKIIISDWKHTGQTNSHWLWKLHVNCPSLIQYFCSWNIRLIWSHLITQNSFLKKRQFRIWQQELELNKLAFKKI